VLDNLKHCHDLGIFTEINVVVGVPGETDADVEEAADFIAQMKPYIGRVAFINPLMLFVGSVYYFEPERHNIKFLGDKDHLYSQYFVSLPDSAWYSEGPYIDHKIRQQRFFRIVERLRDACVPLGAFANFTAEYRQRHGEDSHTLTQPKPVSSEAQAAASAHGHAASVVSPEAVGADPVSEVASAFRSDGQEKTEFQKTFYGSWSSAFLRADSYRGVGSTWAAEGRVIKLDCRYYLTRETAVQRSQVVKHYSYPILLREYKQYNLVGYKDQVLGAPLLLGHIDLTRDEARGDLRILKGRSEDEVTAMIDCIEAAIRLREAPRPAPFLLRSYKSYNLVKYLAHILGAPLALGPIDLSDDAVRRDPQIIKGASEQEVISQIDGAMAAAQDAPPPAERVEITRQAGFRNVNMGAGVLLRWGK
jgi:hypothetical protein